jgi:hypothetical protein
MGSFSRTLTCLALSFAPAACGGGSSTAAVSPTSAAQQRLQGDWHLVSFQPSLQLEAPLQGLLDAQLRALTLTFDAGSFTASGPGVDTSGRYEVTSASGDSLTGRIYDRAGAGYGITGQFVGAQLRFQSTDSPWAGQGVLERAR